MGIDCSSIERINGSMVVGGRLVAWNESNLDWMGTGGDRRKVSQGIGVIGRSEWK